MGFSLSDWGEFRVLAEIVLPKLRDVAPVGGLGDDSAFFQVGDQTVVVSTDVGPRPMVWNLGHHSYWTWGWYGVLVNASDIVSAGARPLGIVTSVDAKRSMQVDDFADFFEGVRAACKKFGFLSLGGNIREAAEFRCHATALGIVKFGGQPIGRMGCTPGDQIVVIGESGRFISTYLKARRLGGLDSLSTEELGYLISPVPPLKKALEFYERTLISAASDNSDGLLGALWNIVERSRCGIDVNLDESILPSRVKEEAKHGNYNPWNLFFFWGDWQIVAAVKSEYVQTFEETAMAYSIPYSKIGVATDGPPIMYGVANRNRAKMNVIRNENFSNQSYNYDEQLNMDYLLRKDIFADHSMDLGPRL